MTEPTDGKPSDVDRGAAYTGRCGQMRRVDWRAAVFSVAAFSVVAPAAARIRGRETADAGGRRPGAPR